MADDTTVVPATQEAGFEPEPVPDSIADTELTGLNPSQADEPEQVETSQEETSEQQAESKEPVPTDEPDEAQESDTQPEEIPEAPAEEPSTTPQPAEEQPLDPKEVARQKYEERQQQKAARDYLNEQRSAIREAEQTLDPNDVARRMEILEAKQYVDTIERNQMAVVSDIQRAQSEIPFFAQNTPQAKAAFEAAVANFANAYGVVDPDSGQWLGAQDRNGNDIPLLPYLQQQAAFYEQVTASTQRQAQQSEAKMRSKAVTPSNPGKVTSSGDELQDLLDKIGDVPLV